MQVSWRQVFTQSGIEGNLQQRIQPRQVILEISARQYSESIRLQVAEHR